MTGQIRGLECFTNGRNLGKKGCPYKPGPTVGIILVPFDFSSPALATSDDATIKAGLINLITAQLHNDSYAARFQHIGKFVDFEDKSEEPTMETRGYGKKTMINRGVQVHEYMHDEGSDYHNALKTFDGKHDQYKVLRYDAQGVITGANKYDATTGQVVGIQGIELDALNVYDRKEADYAVSSRFRVGFTFADSAELNEEMFAIATGINVAALCELNSVIDVMLTSFTVSTTRVHDFIVRTANGSINLGDTFGATLADSTAWVAYNKTSGVSIAVTSVAYNANSKKYTVTFTAGAGYVNGQVAVVRLADVSVLAGLDVEFYESDAVESTMLS